MSVSAYKFMEQDRIRAIVSVGSDGRSLHTIQIGHDLSLYAHENPDALRRLIAAAQGLRAVSASDLVRLDAGMRWIA